MLDLIDGITAYFDRALPLILLYKSERPQYEKYKNMQPSSIYGVEHFLRLFVKLPELLSRYKGINNNQIQMIMKKFQEILNFIQKRESYFLEKSQYIANNDMD